MAVALLIERGKGRAVVGPCPPPCRVGWNYSSGGYRLGGLLLDPTILRAPPPSLKFYGYGFMVLWPYYSMAFRGVPYNSNGRSGTEYKKEGRAERKMRMKEVVSARKL
jgi:hypothetical protein